MKLAAVGRRYDTVDLLRGFAILGVILLHISNYISAAGQTIGSSFPAWLRYLIFSEGGNGVSAFFAISGLPDYICFNLALWEPC